MKKKHILLIGIIIILLVSLLIIVKKKETKILNITFSTMEKIVSQNDYSLVYNGEIDEEIKAQMKDLKSDYLFKLYNVFTTKEELTSYLESKSIDASTVRYFVFVKDELVGVIEDNDPIEKYQEKFDFYLYNKLPESEIYYKTLSKAEDYIKKVNSKSYTVAIFGYEGCSYCTLYIPVFNKIAKEKKLNIYYFDRDHYDEDEWDSIMELDLEIPGECTMNGEATSMAQTFPKPMTIITKSGKLVGCIRGYVTEDVLLAKLNEFKIIKEKKK